MQKIILRKQRVKDALLDLNFDFPTTLHLRWTSSNEAWISPLRTLKFLLYYYVLNYMLIAVHLQREDSSSSLTLFP